MPELSTAEPDAGGRYSAGCPRRSPGTVGCIIEYSEPATDEALPESDTVSRQGLTEVEGSDERYSSPQEETQDRRRQQGMMPAVDEHSLPVFREMSAPDRGSPGAAFLRCSRLRSRSPD